VLQAEAQQLVEAETAQARELERSIAGAEVCCQRHVQNRGRGTRSLVKWDAVYGRPLACGPSECLTQPLQK
jgi:hypothetical protein